MKDLNSQQIVLLCLLVSFVTSIATGITSVALMDQAPDPVAHTIQRVVEKTIEKVTPEDVDDKRTVVIEKSPEKEIVTVIVKEEDLTIEAVEKNSASVARIFTNGTNGTFLGLGIVISAKGDVITDPSILGTAKKFTAKINDKQYPYVYITDKSSKTLALMTPDEDSPVAVFTPAVFGDSQNVRLAQSVISLSGSVSSTVSTGIITQLKTDAGIVAEKDSTPETIPLKPITEIVASVDPTNIISGSLLINLQGAIVGMKIRPYSESSISFMPANAIRGYILSIGS